MNVGGTGKLPMDDLRAMCETLGWQQVRTYIASGNVVFGSVGSVDQCKQQLEKALNEYAGKPVGVMLRHAAEMPQVMAEKAFADAPVIALTTRPQLIWMAASAVSAAS